MINCIVYDEEFKTAYRAIIAEQIFIYGFLFMMLIVIGLMLFDAISSKIQACREMRRK